MTSSTAKRFALTGTLFLTLGAGAQGLDDMAAAADAFVKASIEENPGLQYAPNRMMVKFREDATEQERLEVYEALGMVALTNMELIPNLERIDTAVSVLQAADILSSFPCVEYAEPDFVVNIAAIPNDPSFNLEWGMQNMNAPQAWDTRTDGTGVIIAVIDTGVDYNHGDLSTNMWENPLDDAVDGIDNDGNGIIDDYWGADFANNDGDPFDDNGHGTHVAGTIGGQGNNTYGVTGVAWDVKIMALKFLSASGSGTYSDAIAAINYAVSHGAFLSNNSWGGYGFSQALRDAFAAAGMQGHLAVCAAGNSAFDTDVTPMYPAGYSLDNIVSVAAIDVNDNIASFSNFGMTSVDVGAPGVSIFSSLPNDSFGNLSGTSMASPHVTGLAALVWSQNPSWTFQQVKDQIMNTARSIPSLAGKCITGATIDAAAAMGTPPPTMGPNKPMNFAAQGKKRKARLTWTDVSSNEDGFQIQRQKKVSGVWKKKGKRTVAANTQLYTWNTGPGVYRFRIRSYNGTGNSSWSAWRKAKVKK